MPDRSRPLTTSPSGRRTSVPAVRYSPASTTQSFPRLMPMPELAPRRQRSPIVTRSEPPPDNVPMIDAPPPMSESSPTTTPWEMRPSTIDVPSVPALKLQKPSCITVVPSARWAPRRTRLASATRTPAGRDVVEHRWELVERLDRERTAGGTSGQYDVGEVGDGDRAEVGPGHGGEQPEHTVEVDRVRRRQAMRQQVQPEVHVGRRRRVRRRRRSSAGRDG